MKYLLCILFSIALYSQSFDKKDLTLQEKVKKIIIDLGLNKDYDTGEDGIEQISFALIDLSTNTPRFAGYNENNFIYPASLYKTYVAAEILKQISQGKYTLNTTYIIPDKNAVDKSKEIFNDPRPLLKANDTVTINYLLDLMITRSDNSAANCLIDIADRVNINKTIKENGWEGSEVTRKYLKRAFEDSAYVKIRGTETCARHIAELFYKVEKNEFVNTWVSEQLKTYLGRQLDVNKLAQGFPTDAMFYHKTGWFSYWSNDAGIVTDGKKKFIIAALLPIHSEEAKPIFKKLAEEIYKVL